MKRIMIVLLALVLLCTASAVLRGNDMAQQKNFVSQPLLKKLNRQNLVTRLQKVEAKTGPKPSATVGKLGEISPDAGDQIAGTYFAVDPATGAVRGYFTATPREDFPGYYLAFFNANGVFQFGVNADNGQAVAGGGAVTLDANGVSVALPDSESAFNMYKFVNADGDAISRLSAWQTLLENILSLAAQSDDRNVQLNIGASTAFVGADGNEAQVNIAALSGGGNVARILVVSNADPATSRVTIAATNIELDGIITSNDVSIFPKAAGFFADEIITAVANFVRIIDTAQGYGFRYNAAAADCANGDEYFGQVFLAAGTYTLHTYGVEANNRAKIDHYVDGTLVGSGQDWYSATGVWDVDKTIANVVIATSGYHQVKMKVNGKNAASSDFVFSVTKVWFVPAAY